MSIRRLPGPGLALRVIVVVIVVAMAGRWYPAAAFPLACGAALGCWLWPAAPARALPR